MVYFLEQGKNLYISLFFNIFKMTTCISIWIAKKLIVMHYKREVETAKKLGADIIIESYGYRGSEVWIEYNKRRFKIRRAVSKEHWQNFPKKLS